MGEPVLSADEVATALAHLLSASAKLARGEAFHDIDADKVSDRTHENFGKLATRILEDREVLRLRISALTAERDSYEQVADRAVALGNQMRVRTQQAEATIDRLRTAARAAITWWEIDGEVGSDEIAALRAALDDTAAGVAAGPQATPDQVLWVGELGKLATAWQGCGNHETDRPERIVRVVAVPTDHEDQP